MPDINNQQEYEQYKANVAAFIAREQLEHISTGTISIDKLGEVEPEQYETGPWFSWKPCECYGSHLGGDREYMNALSQGALVQFTICTDCVYFLAYGRLDDQTMSRVEVRQ